MPPIVDLEEALPRPGIAVGAHPRDAVFLAALHFHDMRHRVLRPAVTRLDLHGAPTRRLRPRVVAALFEAESVHAEHGVISWRRCRPRRHRPRDAIAQQPGIAGEEVDLVAGL